jgi:Predicted membrane protein
MRYVIAYLSTAFVFLAIDAVWLSFIIIDFFTAQLGDALLEKPNLAIAAGFYLIYAAGVVFFAVRPALASQSWRVALGYGAFLGVLAYGTYDLTNLATLKAWSWQVVAVDVPWGTFLTGISALAGYAVTKRFSR